MTGPQDRTISYSVELVRKAIHFSSIAIPMFYMFTLRSVALAVFIPLTVMFVSIDIARHYHPSVQEWFYGTFGRLLRGRESNKERKRLNGATYVLISATLCVALFPKFIAVVSLMIMSISDLFSALIGRRFGKHRFLGKSFEGTSAFFLSALLITILTPKIDYVFGEYLVGAISALAGAIVEALPWELDDNLTIPLSVGFTMWAAYALWYPSLNVYKFG